MWKFHNSRKKEAKLHQYLEIISVNVFLCKQQYVRKTLLQKGHSLKFLQY